MAVRPRFLRRDSKNGKLQSLFRLPTFVVQLSFEAAERDISYEEIAASINKEKVAELLCLDALGYSAEDIEIITPEEYDEEMSGDD